MAEASINTYVVALLCITMVQQHVELTHVANFPGTEKSQAFMTSKGHVLTVKQIRTLIDNGVAVIINDKNSGKITTVTKRDETSIQAVRDDTKENNIDSLPEFEL